MSQYPYPYNMPDPYYGGPVGHDYTRQPRARRAGILLIVLGAMMLLLGFCCAAIPLSQPAEKWDEMMSQVIEDQPAAGEAVDPSLLRQLFIVMGVIGLGAGLAYVVLGALVMRGSSIAIILAIILDGLVIALLLLMIALSLIAAASGSVADLLGVCMNAVPLSLLIWSIVWLVQARSGASTPPGAYPPYWQPPPPGGYPPPPPGGYPPPPPQ